MKERVELEKEITNWLKLKASGKSPIIIEESMEHASNLSTKQPIRSQLGTGWTWKTNTRILTH